MKKSFALLAVLTAVVVLFFQARVNSSSTDSSLTDDEPMLAYSKKAKAVIDAKCYGCHSDDGKSDKAKEALLWDKLPTLEKIKMVSTLDEIIEVLEEGTMPPEKFLARKPEAKLTEKEVKTLMNWAEKSADNLLK